MLEQHKEEQQKFDAGTVTIPGGQHHLIVEFKQNDRVVYRKKFPDLAMFAVVVVSLSIGLVYFVRIQSWQQRSKFS